MVRNQCNNFNAFSFDDAKCPQTPLPYIASHSNATILGASQCLHSLSPPISLALKNGPKPSLIHEFIFSRRLLLNLHCCGRTCSAVQSGLHHYESIAQRGRNFVIYLL